MPKHLRDGIAYYTSPLLDHARVKHGFFTRVGGVSVPPLDSLNVKLLGDTEAHVVENRLRACRALAVDATKLVFALLDHQDKVRIISKNDAGNEIPHVDALISSLNLPLMLSTADCVPIILAEPGKWVGLIHASWRSLVAGIIERSFAKLNTIGAEPSKIVAASGPAIATENYEVGDDVVAVVRQKFPFHEKVLITQKGKTYFDLRKTVGLQLQGHGVNQIDHLAIDTYSHTDDFYSYRKEGETGRFATIVSP